MAVLDFISTIAGWIWSLFYGLGELGMTNLDVLAVDGFVRDFGNPFNDVVVSFNIQPSWVTSMLDNLVESVGFDPATTPVFALCIGAFVVGFAIVLFVKILDSLLG